MLLVRTTSSNKVHDPFVIVQRKVTELPTAIPVTALAGEDGVVTDAVPLTMPHKPLPTLGLLPANVNEALLQLL